MGSFKPLKESTVVIVDDDLQYSRELVYELMLRGKRAMALGSGKSAAEYYRNLVNDEGLPDLIVLSLSLPELEGLEFLQELKKEGLLGTLLLLSEDFSKDELDDLLKTPHVACLPKSSKAKKAVEDLSPFIPPRLHGNPLLAEEAKRLGTVHE